MVERPGTAFDVPYGDGPGEKLDLFPAPRPAGSAAGPVFVFIHGGYWRALDKRDFSFIAPPFVAAGISVVMVNYDLAPRVEVETIVAQTQAALGWVIANLARLGGDPARLFVGGHSAGGQLTALALLTGLKLAGGPRLERRVRPGCRCSAPTSTTRSASTRPGRAGSAHSTSTSRLGRPCWSASAAGESRGLRRPILRFRGPRAGSRPGFIPSSTTTTIMLELARPASAIHQDAVRFMGG
ncbi:MAG: alpha/beta hydrolase [Pseudomonadota bacterium]